jgi:hypothetical protein
MNSFNLQAVIVKKPIDLDEAKKIAKQFIDNKKYYRETTTSYRFRNIPKGHFDPNSFWTKKINKNISLVLGNLKD